MDEIEWFIKNRESLKTAWGLSHLSIEPNPDPESGFYYRFARELDEHEYLTEDPKRITQCSQCPVELKPNVRELPLVQTFTNNTKRIGPNDKCPCGSGKKYKKCHMNQ